MIYSSQAKMYLEVIGDNFDAQEFEKWYLKNAVVGGGDIMLYLKLKKDGKIS